MGTINWIFTHFFEVSICLKGLCIQKAGGVGCLKIEAVLRCHKWDTEV